MFDLIHKENIKKTRETITPIVDTKKVCVSKHSIEISQRQHKKSSRSRKRGLTNSGNLVEIIKRRVEGGDKNLEKPASLCLIIYSFCLDFFLFGCCGVSKQTVVLISYSFLCFTAWLANIGQKCSICWQQENHLEMYVFSINTTNHSK